MWAFVAIQIDVLRQVSARQVNTMHVTTLGVYLTAASVCAGHGSFPPIDCVPDTVNGVRFIRDLYEMSNDTSGNPALVPCTCQLHQCYARWGMAPGSLWSLCSPLPTPCWKQLWTALIVSVFGYRLHMLRTDRTVHLGFVAPA